METDIEKIKRKIKKLLALSASPNENEAAAAIEKAREIMGEYGLSESQCLYERHSARATKRASLWRSVLAKPVAWLYCCEVFRVPHKGEMCFFGESFDAFMAREMYGYLSKTIERMARLNVKKSAKRPFREKYKLGIACSLRERIHDMGAKASWAPQWKGKKLAIRKALENEIELVAGSTKIPSGKMNAFRRGTRAGDGICLSRQTTGHGGRYIEAR